jgi:tetratricopeptide (TPR) repeat protein
MIDLYEKFPSDLKEADICRQQYALALNRDAGDKKAPNLRNKAILVLNELLKDHGGSAETYGILGRIYKDMYREATASKSLEAAAYLDKAIETYRKGFEVEPADYFPGVNAITLLLQKGDEESQEQVNYLTPLVSFAVARRGGLKSTDYWDLATVLELALIGRDDQLAERALSRVLASASAAGASWMAQTTADNLKMVKELRKGQEDTTSLDKAISALREKERDLAK